MGEQGDAGTFAAALVRDSLGLPSGSLKESDLPRRLVSEIESTMRGREPKNMERLLLEERIAALLPRIERDSLESDGYFVRKERWPSGAEFAVALTHDVDNVSRPWAHILKIQDRFDPHEVDLARRGRLSLYNNLRYIAEREREAGFRSSFYLMSANYPLGELKGETERLLAGGWDVGLHGDFGTHASLARMKRAVADFRDGLGFKPGGVREHYLKFDYAKSWQVMDAAGFDYDTTVGNTDRLGFRLGLTTPFHPPDARWRPLRLLELPLSLMDTTLWGYLHKSEEGGMQDVLRSLGTVSRVGGLFTLLWHQEAVRMRGGRTYWKVLEGLGRMRKRCFVGSGADISRWWKGREVALKATGSLITLGSRPPRGLTLSLGVKKGLRIKVIRGSFLKVKGQIGEPFDRYRVVPNDRGFELEVLK
ncbi:MAG: hypothetical protein JRN64_02585 [Nitrososphaerota archaeon]|nr:hypothetical protein [Nitrososphaerota archaeon]